MLSFLTPCACCVQRTLHISGTPEHLDLPAWHVMHANIPASDMHSLCHLIHRAHNILAGVAVWCSCSKTGGWDELLVWWFDFLLTGVSGSYSDSSNSSSSPMDHQHPSHLPIHPFPCTSLFEFSLVDSPCCALIDCQFPQSSMFVRITILALVLILQWWSMARAWSSTLAGIQMVPKFPHTLSVLPVVLGRASTISMKLQGRMRGDDVGLAWPGWLGLGLA